MIFRQTLAGGAGRRRARIHLLLMLMLLAGTRHATAGPGEDADAAYARGDYAAAMGFYRELANNGVAAAQFNLGVMFDFGQGVGKNPAEAARWYRTAATQGHAGAQFNLAGLYYDGVGVPQDHLRAYVWFTLAAIAGAPGASRNRHALARQLDAAQLEQAHRAVRACQAQRYAGCD